MKMTAYGSFVEILELARYDFEKFTLIAQSLTIGLKTLLIRSSLQLLPKTKNRENPWSLDLRAVSIVVVLKHPRPKRNAIWKFLQYCTIQI